MAKIVNLTLHRNTLQKRQERETSQSLVSDAKHMARHKDVAGYAVVSWNKDQDCEVEWSLSDRVSTNMLPEFIRGAIRRRISMMDNE